MRKKILVVDDEKSIRDMLSAAFTKEGYEVQLAENAEKALKIVKETGVHVMFFDLKMPGMNGLELCRKIKTDRPMAIIHAVTGFVSLFELADCREAGFEDYFTKPVNIEQLYRAADIAFEKIERWKKR